MPFAVSTNYRLAYNKETVWGTPLTTGARFLRLVSANLKPDLGFTQSNEINAVHRQTADTINTMAKGGGSLEGEMSYNAYEDLLGSLVGADWAGTTTRTLRIGTLLRSVTLQEQYGDLSNVFRVYSGAIVNSWSLNLQVGQVVTTSFGFVSRKPVPAAATAIGTVANANTNPVFNPLADVRVLQEGATPTTITGVQSISLNVQNDITEIMALGSADAAALIPARVKITGTIALFKQDDALITKYLNLTNSRLIMRLGGATNAHYEFTLPNIRYTSYDGGASQSNAITERFGFEGLYDVTDSALRIVATD
jgi:hypothetical protein